MKDIITLKRNMVIYLKTLIQRIDRLLATIAADILQ